MDIKSIIRRLFSGARSIILLFVLLLTSLYLISGATHNSALFSRLYSFLLGINILAIVLFIGLIGKSVWRLIKQYRQRVTGSRLTARLVLIFIILSVTPVSVVYYFSLDFLQRGIDSWFDVRVENALNDALELGQASLGLRMQESLHQTKSIKDPLTRIPDEAIAPTLNDLRESIGASELTLFSHNGRIIASSSSEASNLIPMRLDESTSLRLREEQDDVGLVPIGEAGLQVRTAIRVASPDPVSPHRILQALFPLSDRINTLAESVQSAFAQYREIAYLRVPLKYSFILTLSLVLLLSILTAIWAAFYFAGRIVQPVADLVEGTRAVASGDYDKRLPLPGRDELGYLVRSFNEMTHKISMAQDEARTSQQQMELQHTYLETVLANLSSGVLTLDKNHMLHTSNMAASNILKIDLEQYEGQSLDKLVEAHQPLHAFVDALYPHLEDSMNTWQDEITLFGPGGRQVLMCRGTQLPDSIEIQGGSIIVFDDITELMQAQRNAAWGEVARRLAHEIKNPLTPIQLSAERLRHKYLDKMELEDADVLDRSTHTIVQQVETLKEMVKAFSDYARMPVMQLQPIDLNDLINEIIELYKNSGFNIDLELDDSAPQIEADVGRLRQLLHNLIKNAMEAMEVSQQRQLTVSTRCAEEHACRFVEMKVEDTGPGIPEEMLSQLFDPYITSKPKGSGLGLAIVKKIVEEHGGMIWAENAKNGGACIIMRLPVINTGSEQDKTKLDNNILMKSKDNAP